MTSKSAEVSLRLLDKAGMTDDTCVLDVGGGDSRLVDHLAARGLTCLAVTAPSSTSSWTNRIASGIGLACSRPSSRTARPSSPRSRPTAPRAAAACRCAATPPTRSLRSSATS